MNSLVEMIAKQENYKIKFIEDTSPIKLLANAEIVILNNTSMILDALALNKQVISFWFKRLNKFSGYGKSKAIKTVYNSNQLVKAIKEGGQQTEKNILEIKKYLKGELFKLDGKSSQRISKFITKLILQKKGKILPP